MWRARLRGKDYLQGAKVSHALSLSGIPSSEPTNFAMEHCFAIFFNRWLLLQRITLGE